MEVVYACDASHHHAPTSTKMYMICRIATRAVPMTWNASHKPAMIATRWKMWKASHEPVMIAMIAMRCWKASDMFVRRDNLDMEHFAV